MSSRPARAGVSAAGADGRVTLAQARSGAGEAWELTGRIEPVAGCATEPAAGYRLSLVARPVRSGSEAQAVRVTPSAVYPTWDAAREALEGLARRVAAMLAEDGAGGAAMGKDDEGEAGPGGR